ncbi:MAG: leucine-rich repeat domain-containing protein [Bacteroides sp.]|nr:leucine-rich repeat domain-containing protein [Bacillota bacterium]MCM1455206.1 leucine-rich repeat domain-containing protein [Bacteroides sp.]
MKKIKLITLCLIFTLISCVCLAGCGGNGVPNYDLNECSHLYTTQTVASTCSTQGYILHTCSKCNDSFKDSYTLATGHNYIEGSRNYYCSKCGKSECEGFNFRLATYNNGEACYVITNASTETIVNGKLEVPRKYESLVVRGIASWSFSGIAQNIKTLIIHDNIKNIFDMLFNGTGIWNPDADSQSTLETIIFDDTCCDMRIESNAFYNCTSLLNVNLKSGMIRYIPCDAVTSNKGGNAEYLFKGTPYFNNTVAKNGLCYITDLLLHADMNEISNNVVIDDGTVAINAATFMDGTFIASVEIPNTIESIGDKAFYGCLNLETITYNGSVEEFAQIAIGVSAFSGLKANKIICNNGDVMSYYYNGWKYNIGE